MEGDKWNNWWTYYLCSRGVQRIEGEGKESVLPWTGIRAAWETWSAGAPLRLSSISSSLSPISGSFLRGERSRLPPQVFVPPRTEVSYLMDSSTRKGDDHLSKQNWYAATGGQKHMPTLEPVKIPKCSELTLRRFYRTGGIQKEPWGLPVKMVAQANMARLLTQHIKTTTKL